MSLFSAVEVTKQYAGYKALDGVSIHVPEGSIFGLLGPNGAGKTTLIRIINQIIAPDQGALEFMGRPLRPDDIALIGYLPEERGLYKKMTVGEQAIYLARLKGLSHADAMTRLRYWFEKFEIQSWWNRKVEELSKGMQQKVQFLVTIIHQPRLLIFDEPFSGFDPINANLLKDEILAQRAAGATVIFSTHNMSSVEELCDDIALINKSRVILSGSVSQIKERHSTRTYNITFEKTDRNLTGLIPEQYEIQFEINDKRFQHARIRIPATATPNDLIRDLLPVVALHGITEMIPSMNDIFIQAVTNQEPTLTQGN